MLVSLFICLFVILRAILILCRLCFVFWRFIRIFLNKYSPERAQYIGIIVTLHHNKFYHLTFIVFTINKNKSFLGQIAINFWPESLFLIHGRLNMKQFDLNYCTRELFGPNVQIPLHAPKNSYFLGIRIQRIKTESYRWGSSDYPTVRHLTPACFTWTMIPR